MRKVMNHSEYQARLRQKSMAELHFIAKDAAAAARAMPDSPNTGYYLDEMHYALMEIRRRQQ